MLCKIELSLSYFNLSSLKDLMLNTFMNPKFLSWNGMSAVTAEQVTINFFRAIINHCNFCVVAIFALV